MNTTHQFPSVIPLQPNSVEVDFPFLSHNNVLSVKPQSTLELLWVNNTSNLLVTPPSLAPLHSIQWLDRWYEDIWVPKNILLPLLEESAILQDTYDNLIVSCWVDRVALLCQATGPLLDSFSVVIVDSSLHSKLLTALEDKGSFPGSCTVFINKQIKHIKLNIPTLRASLEEPILAAVATDTQVFIYKLTLQVADNKEKINMRHVETLPFKTNINSIVFTKEYLSVITCDGGVFLWEPHDSSRIRVVKKGTETRGRFMGVQGPHYNSVLVAGEQNLFLYDFRGKMTYQRLLKSFGDSEPKHKIQAIQTNLSTPNHLFLHSNTLNLYDIRYLTTPFTIWSRDHSFSSSIVHSLHSLPSLDGTNFILSATTKGDVHMYQYKDGVSLLQTDSTDRPKWNPLQSLSDLASQYNTFSHSNFIQTSIPHPTQVPYLFSNMHSLSIHQAAEIKPRFAGVAILPNWVLDSSDLDFQMFYISHYGDVYTQTLTQYNFSNTQTGEKDFTITKLGELAASVLQERAKDFEVYIEIHEGTEETTILDNFDFTETNETEADVLKFMDGVDFPVTLEDVSSNTNKGVNETSEVLQNFEIDPNTPTSSTTNTLVRERIDPRVTTVPVDTIPVMTTPAEMSVDDEIRPNLDVYFVNSSIIGAPVEEDDVPESTSGRTIAQNRRDLESIFEKQMTAFMSATTSRENGSSAPSSGRSSQQRRLPPSVVSSQQLPTISASRTSSQGSQNYASGSQNYSSGSQGYASGSQHLSGSQNYTGDDFSASQNASGYTTPSVSSQPSSQPGSQPGSQPSSQPARPRKRRALGF